MASRPRELAAGLLVAAGSVITLLALVEATLRLSGFAPERFKSPGRVLSGDGHVALDGYPANPRGYFPIDLRDPATRTRYEAQGVTGLDDLARRAPHAVEYRYNSLGFRDAEIGPKPARVQRVLVLGDSFTEGQGVREEDTYPRVLENLLNAAGPVRWEVRNCGHRGWNFPKLYEVFETLLGLDPDVVVYGMVLNDPGQSPEFRERQRYLDDWILDRRRVAGSTGEPGMPLLRSRLAAFVGERLEAWRVGRETTRWYLDMYGEPNREGWDRTQRHLRIMNRTMDRRGGHFLVASWPLLVGMERRYPFEALHAIVGRACEEAGIPRVDLLGVLRGRPTHAICVGPVDRHPNEVAHRLAAEALAPVVRRLVAATRRPGSDGLPPRPRAGRDRTSRPRPGRGSRRWPLARSSQGPWRTTAGRVLPCP